MAMTFKKRLLAVFLCLIFVLCVVVQPVFANPVVPIVAGLGVAIVFSLIVGALGVSFPNNDSAYNSAYAAYEKVQESATLAPGLAAFMAAYQAGEAINAGKDFLLGLWNELQSLGFEAGKTDAATIDFGPLSGVPAADFAGMDPWTLLESEYIGVGYIDSSSGNMTVKYVISKPQKYVPATNRTLVFIKQLTFSDYFAGKPFSSGVSGDSQWYGNPPNFYGVPIIEVQTPTSAKPYFYFNVTLVGSDMSSQTFSMGGVSNAGFYPQLQNPVFLGSKAIDDLVSGKNLQGADYYSGATTGALTNVGNMGDEDVVVVPNANVQMPSADVVSGDIIPGWLDDVVVPDDPAIPDNPAVPSADAIGDSVATSVGEKLEALFIPSETYLSSKFSDLISKFPDFQDLGPLQALTELGEKKPKFTVNLNDYFGINTSQDGINIDIWDDKRFWIKNLVRGVVILLLVIFDYNMIVKLIRGSIFTDTGTGPSAGMPVNTEAPKGIPGQMTMWNMKR